MKVPAMTSEIFNKKIKIPLDKNNKGAYIIRKKVFLGS